MSPSHRIPATSPSQQTLNESGLNTVRKGATKRALRHLVQVAEPTSAALLSSKISTRRRSRLGGHIELLHNVAGALATHTAAPPPDEAQLRVQLDAGNRRPKRNLAQMALRQLAEGHCKEEGETSENSFGAIFAAERSGFWSSLGAQDSRFGAAVYAFWSNFEAQKSTVWSRLETENVEDLASVPQASDKKRKASADRVTLEEHARIIQKLKTAKQREWSTWSRNFRLKGASCGDSTTSFSFYYSHVDELACYTKEQQLQDLKRIMCSIH
ncbi:hypothetical protein ISCGN_028519 [Ixodes scapularis]